MRQGAMNRGALAALILFSATALLSVLTGYLPNHPPQADEGTAAHIFQLSAAAFALVTVLFLITADWTRLSRTLRRLAIPMVTMALAFAALYYLENVYFAAHYR